MHGARRDCPTVTQMKGYVRVREESYAEKGGMYVVSGCILTCWPPTRAEGRLLPLQTELDVCEGVLTCEASDTLLKLEEHGKIAIASTIQPVGRCRLMDVGACLLNEPEDHQQQEGGERLLRHSAHSVLTGTSVP